MMMKKEKKVVIDNLDYRQKTHDETYENKDKLLMDVGSIWLNNIYNAQIVQ